MMFLLAGFEPGSFGNRADTVHCAIQITEFNS